MPVFSRYQYLLLLLIPLLISILYYPVWQGNWTWDDPSILKHAVQYSPREYFTQPEAWRDLSPANLTPWMSLSFDLDLSLFGLEPQGFYAHQLLALLWVGLALFAVLNLWLAPTWSLAGVLLWLCSAPVQTLVLQLMTRHYLEGLGFALLALWFYVKAVRDSRWLWAGFGAFFYALACTAKEVYVPLLLLLPWLPESHFLQRLRYLLPLVLLAAVYVLWRFYMLGSSGGYGAPINWLVAPALPVSILHALLGQTLFSWIAIGLLVLALFYALWQQIAVRWLLPLLLFLVLAPLLPVQHFLTNADSYRLLILPSVVFSAGLVLILSRLDGFYKTAAWGGYALIWLLFIGQNQHAAAQLKPQLAQFAAQARFIQQALSAHTLVNSQNWFETGLAWLQREYVGVTPPHLLFDWIEVQGQDLRGRRFFSFAAKCACIQEITQDAPSLLAAWQQNLREAPLSVQVSEQNSLVRWQFAPYTSGAYQLIVPDLFGVVPLPAGGQMRARLPEVMRFCVRYTDPEGWHTYSPWLTLTLKRGDFAQVSFSR